MNMKQYPLIVYYAALTLAVLTWGSSFPAFKVALSAYTPVQVLAGRMVTASLFCLPLILRMIRASYDRRTWLLILAAVLCEPCFYFLLEGYSMRYTTSSQAGLMLAAMPLTVAVGASIFLGERLSIRGWIGLAMTIAGCVVLSLAADATESAPNPLLGNTLEFFATILGAAYTLLAKFLSRRVSPAELTGAMSIAGAIFFSSLCLLPQGIDSVPLEVEVPSWLPLACIVYLGAVVMLVGYGMYNFALSGMPAGQVVTFMNLVPVWSLFIGVVFLHDRMNSLQYGAAFLVIAGVLVAQYQRRNDHV